MPCKTEIEDEGGVRDPTFPSHRQPTSKQASSHIYGLTAAPVKIHHLHTPQYGTGSPQQTPHRPQLVFYPRKPPPHGSILFSQHHPPTQTRPTICDKNSTDTPPPPWGFAVDTTPCVSCLYTPHNPAIYQDRKPDSPTEEGIKKRKKKTRECRLQAAIQPSSHFSSFHLPAE